MKPASARFRAIREASALSTQHELLAAFIELHDTCDYLITHGDNPTTRALHTRMVKLKLRKS